MRHKAGAGGAGTQGSSTLEEKSMVSNTTFHSWREGRAKGPWKPGPPPFLPRLATPSTTTAWWVRTGKQAPEKVKGIHRELSKNCDQEG